MDYIKSLSDPSPNWTNPLELEGVSKTRLVRENFQLYPKFRI